MLKGRFGDRRSGKALISGLVKSRSPATNETGSFVPGTTFYSHPVVIEPGARAATFVLLWHDPLIESDMAVVDPSGVIHEASPMPLGRFLRVENPASGTWTMLPDPDALTFARTSPFIVRSYIDNQKIEAAAGALRSVVRPGEPVRVCAWPRDETLVTGATISGHAETPSGRQVAVSLFDVTGSGDQFAGDGEYCTEFTDTTERGAYTFRLKAEAEEVGRVSGQVPFTVPLDREPTDFERWAEFSVTVDDIDPFGDIGSVGGKARGEITVGDRARAGQPVTYGRLNMQQYLLIIALAAGIVTILGMAWSRRSTRSPA